MANPNTVFAVSSGAGKAGVAVVRVSGPGASNALKAMCGDIPHARTAVLRKIVHPGSGELLDQGLVLWFPHPESFTGEDVAEFHIHGGPAVVTSVVEALSVVDGLRLAEAGEFTRRAFEAGKLDLSSVEGLADLINAQTNAQRRLALRDASGGLSARCDVWRDVLVRSLAMVEADIDFADERDVPNDLVGLEVPKLVAVVDEMDGWLVSGAGGEILRSGFHVVIAGLPNVGKSSLLNAIAGRNAAIVTDVPGTTRDVIEVFLDLGGFPVVVSDTAGLRDTESVVERIGVDQARSSVGEAELVVWVCDERGVWPKEARSYLDSDALWVRNKSDLAPASVSNQALPVIDVSAVRGWGVRKLISQIESRAKQRMGGAESIGLARSRQVVCLRECQNCLKRGLEVFDGDGGQDELVGESLRQALHALGRLSGRVDVEDLLDVVFGEFCIGK